MYDSSRTITVLQTRISLIICERTDQSLHNYAEKNSISTETATKLCLVYTSIKMVTFILSANIFCRNSKAKQHFVKFLLEKYFDLEKGGIIF